MNTEKHPKQQIANKIKNSGNILVTVARNPSVDALAAAIALTLALDKLKKHATSVFSGDIPPAINFLEPEKMFENNADSLRDFVISLSKDKADRLRFKPDGDMVRIYITPYKTKLSSDDLSFSDGDFNIELVLAIGVDSRDDLDDAIASHGRILHSATTATIGLADQKDSLGAISWQDGDASSYSEMVDGLISNLSGEKDFIDSQIATAILTGLVSATDQFRNAKTSATVMTMAANLMAKGANQQLIASELSGANTTNTQNGQPSPENSAKKSRTRDGLVITHELNNSEKWNPTVNQNEQIQAENDKIAEDNALAAHAEAQNQLQQISEQQIPAEQTVSTEQQAPLTEAPAGTAELDGIITGSQSSTNIMTDLNNFANSPTPLSQNSSLSHGEPYINNNFSPINSALLNEDLPTSDGSFSGLRTDSHITISPPVPEAAPTENSAPAPEMNLPMPPELPPMESFAASAPQNIISADNQQPPMSSFDSLPPIPPLAPETPDIASLAQSASDLASVAQAPTMSAPAETNAPFQPAPMSEPAPAAPVSQDPTQFQIPGM